jgi:hypothetical protein
MTAGIAVFVFEVHCRDAAVSVFDAKRMLAGACEQKWKRESGTWPLPRLAQRVTQPTLFTVVWV